MTGYSLKLAEAINAMEGDSLGIRLGKLCVEKNMPVEVVARAMGVSRETVYNWFLGKYTPARTHEARIESFMARHAAATR